MAQNDGNDVKPSRQQLITSAEYYTITDRCEAIIKEEITEETYVKEEIDEDVMSGNELNQEEQESSQPNKITSEEDHKVQFIGRNKGPAPKNLRCKNGRNVESNKISKNSKILEKIRCTSLVVPLIRMSINQSKQQKQINNSRIRGKAKSKSPEPSTKRRRRTLKDSLKDDDINPLRLGDEINNNATFKSDTSSGYHFKTKKPRKANKNQLIKEQSTKRPVAANTIVAPCHECNKTFISIKEYITHMNSDHTTNHVKCAKCDEIFSNAESLQEHSNSVHPDKPFVCEDCPESKSFSKRHNYEMHVMSHTGEIPYECQQCHKKFSNARDYCKHQKLSMNCGKSYGLFECKECSKVFKAKFLLLCHTLQMHQKVKKFGSHNPCEICGTVFKNLYSLQYHYSWIHTAECIYYCDICGDSFASVNVFKTHRRSHLGNVNVNCELCGKSFANHFRLKNHINLTHTEVSERPLICEKCGKTFTYRTERDYHCKKCGKSKKIFTCEICGKTFVKPHSLQDHLRTHDGNLYSCTMCEKQFTSRSGLSLHLKTKHLKVELLKYVCETCGNVYAARNSYLNHIKKKHLSESFECKTCGETFDQQIKMYDHRRTVHFGKTRNCRFCDKAFVKHWERVSHETSEHLDQLGKRFKCPVCGMCFDKPSSRAAHRRLQHSELITSKTVATIPKCETCNLTFSSLQAFQKHNKRHEKYGNVIVKCDICKKEFLGGRGLKLHMNSTHKIMKRRRTAKSKPKLIGHIL